MEERSAQQVILQKVRYGYVLALALILRLAWIFRVPIVPIADGAMYDLFARNLVNGIGYAYGPGNLTAYWPVGASFAYSLIYRIFGFHFVPIALFNVLVALLGIWLAMVLAEIWFGSEIAILTGLILSIWPGQIEFTSIISSDLLFNLFVLACVICWLSPGRWLQHFWFRIITIALFAAAASYMRPMALLLPALLGLLTLLQTRRIRSALIQTCAVGLVMLAFIAPWTLRNEHRLHAFILISSNGGDNLYQGNHPGTIGEADDLPPETVPMSEVDRNRYTGALAKAYIRQHPARFLARGVKKIAIMYSRESIGVYWNPSIMDRFGATAFRFLKYLSNAYWYAILLVSFAGFVILSRRTSLIAVVIHPCVAICLYYTAVYAVTHASDRYHYACSPFMAMLAGLCLSVILHKRASAS